MIQQKNQDEKIVMLADLHFGAKKNNYDFFLSQKKFFTRQLIPYLTHHEIKYLFILGDVFDNRESINVRIFAEVFKLFLELSKCVKNIVIITGNHDIYYKNRTDIHSLHSLEAISNIKIYEKIDSIEISGRKIVLCPWLIDKNHLINYINSNEKTIQDSVLMGHLELSGFSMDKINRFCSEDSLEQSVFDYFSKVYSGHFHYRSLKNNVEYIGSPYHLTRIDSNTERGFVVLNLKSLKEEFIENTESARFIQIKLEDLKNIKDKEKFLKGNILDIFVSGKEYNDIELLNMIDDLEKLNLLFPIKIITESSFLGNVDIDVENYNVQFDILTILQDYVKEVNLDNKEKVLEKLKDLYNNS